MPSVGSSAIKCNLAKFRVRAAEVTFYSDLEKGTDIVDVGVNTESSFATTAAHKKSFHCGYTGPEFLVRNEELMSFREYPLSTFQLRLDAS